MEDFKSTSFQPSVQSGPDYAAPPDYKVWYIVIGVVMILILVAYGVWIYVTHSKGTGLFKDYTPKINTAGLVEIQKDKYAVKLTPEQEAKRKAMIQAALDKVKARK